MESRILKFQEMSKNKRSAWEELELIRQESVRCAEEKRHAENIKQLIEKIPLRFRYKTFKDFAENGSEQIKIKKLAERYVETFNDRLNTSAGLIFLGNPGTGKTMLSLIMYQELALSGYRVRYEPSSDFLNYLLDIKFKSQSAFQSAKNQYQETQLLILDEITESISRDGIPTEMERQLLFRIINERYERGLCTLIVSNRNKTGLIERLGAPIVDRLSENGVFAAFKWDSYRSTLLARTGESDGGR